MNGFRRAPLSFIFAGQRDNQRIACAAEVTRYLLRPLKGVLFMAWAHELGSD